MASSPSDPPMILTELISSGYYHKNLMLMLLNIYFVLTLEFSE